MTKDKINYAKEDKIPGDLDYKEAKVKVSMFLDGDLLLAVKSEAKRTGQKYQSLINKTLREVFLKEVTKVNPDDYLELKKRVEILEQAFLNKGA